MFLSRDLFNRCCIRKSENESIMLTGGPYISVRRPEHYADRRKRQNSIPDRLGLTSNHRKQNTVIRESHITDKTSHGIEYQNYIIFCISLDDQSIMQTGGRNERLYAIDLVA